MSKPCSGPGMTSPSEVRRNRVNQLENFLTNIFKNIIWHHFAGESHQVVKLIATYKASIFHHSDFHDFYTIKSLWLGYFVVNIFVIFRGSFRAARAQFLFVYLGQNIFFTIICVGVLTLARPRWYCTQIDLTPLLSMKILLGESETRPTIISVSIQGS
jgi:hypothetical protein